MIKHFIAICSIGLWMISLVNGQSLTLADCHRLARDNYPAIRKLDLIAKSAEYDLENANKRYLPQVSFSGQATYQSQVMDYADLFGGAPLPGGMTPPVLSKDQYRVMADVRQLLFDGGNIKHQKELVKANAAVQEQNIQTQLYNIDQRINTIYFSILLMDAQLKQNELLQSNLRTQIKKTEVALQNGVAFRSNLDELRAEIVNIEMASTELLANRQGFLQMLSLFIGQELSADTELLIPHAETVYSTINRPELKAFELQQSLFDVQKNGLRTSYLPQISAFVQGAYGRPTLNMLENKFGPWYMTGVRFNWSLGSLYSLSNRKNSLNIHQQMVDADRETFLMNTEADLARESEQVKKYHALIRQDDEIIALRSSVTKSAEAQLNNGVITTHEYIQKLNAEHLARQTKILHEIQLLQAKYNQKFITGN